LVVKEHIVNVSGKHIPVFCFVSSVKSESKIVVIRDCVYSGHNIQEIVLSELQLVILETIGIYPTEVNWHHLVQQTLYKSLRKAIYIAKYKDDKDKYCNLEKEFEFEFVNLLPIHFHEIYNKIFRNCLIPEEVIERLNKIFLEEKLSSPRKNDVIEFFSFIAILLNDVNNINIDEICRLRKSKKSIVVSDLLKLLRLSENNVREYVEMLFLYPNYKEKKECFFMLCDINRRGE